MDNPFNPSFGKMPNIFLNRDSLTNRIINELNRGNSPYQTSLIYGQRGSGKTTLMTNITNQLNDDKNWIVINLILDDDLLISLINQLQNSLVSLKLSKTLDLDLKFNFMGLGLEASVNQQVEENFQLIFENILKKLTQKGYKVLLCIDEVKLDPLLKKLASTYQIMIREDLNVSLLMAGLPENVSEIQNDDVLTFLLRANRIILSPLSVEDVKLSYHHIFTEAGYQLDQTTLLYMTKQTLGFAYAFQLLGYHVWNAAKQQADKLITEKTIDSILGVYTSDLNRNVYFKVYSELSAKEKEFVQAMVKAKNNKVKSKTIGQIMHKDANYISVYRRKLIDDQIIQPADYGYVSFLLPKFDQFVQQQMILDEI
ncbi:MAG: ATP-binding protein [Lactobacillus sp.]|jgi:Cdc6-like AAA superfamily ATPase|nr:ATP-binding protein [Lactobacillus sp.]MCH3905510.1 ATP-binding protein [Lactobacillus sp.]MCH3990922.1 ATP-binding protein [Lactobacillus sp.]MCH4068362.1 ATP-binding protein [Lactobacillus sp.]MCI1304375.1 ATP-binding protein [Lactobacillus sp.]